LRQNHDFATHDFASPPGGAEGAQGAEEGGFGGIGCEDVRTAARAESHGTGGGGLDEVAADEVPERLGEI